VVCPPHSIPDAENLRSQEHDGLTPRRAVDSARNELLEVEMIVVRFKIQCSPERAAEVEEAMRAVVAPSALDGVISFDIGKDLADPCSFVATEVFDDRQALERQEAQDEVARVMSLLESALVAEPEATIFDVASSEPYA
jgi:quinol monooxygenase YgiN